MEQQTAIDWLVDNLKPIYPDIEEYKLLIGIAKAMQTDDIDNKVIHFAEWLTKKHTLTLITLYEQFEELHYNEEL